MRLFAKGTEIYGWAPPVRAKGDTAMAPPWQSKWNQQAQRHVFINPQTGQRTFEHPQPTYQPQGNYGDYPPQGGYGGGGYNQPPPPQQRKSRVAEVYGALIAFTDVGRLVVDI